MTTNVQEMFGSLLLDKKIVASLTAMGFEEPSPIQEQTIPLVLEGSDVIGQAQTGTGKTAAFGIPVVQSITDHRHIQALIMTPTRELAIQVAEEIGKIGRTSKIKALPVYGGQPIDRQIRALRSGVQIVIGTPGRLIDHINRKTIKLDHIKFLVLDEADEMLDMGFVDDMEEIMKNLPAERQTLLFSATMPRPILSLTKKYMKAPKNVTISKEELTVPLIDQYYFETKDKIEGLCRLLDARGIDIDNITHVINFDIPQDPESYVHRIGRTGRAGNTGVAMTFITPREFRQLKLIERTTKTKITRRQLPTTANVIERQREMIVSKMQSVLDQSNYHDYMPIAASLLKEYDAEDVVAAALKLMQEGNKALEASPEDILAKDLSNTGGRPGMVRLFMNIGRSQKVTVQDIVRTIAIEADIPAKEVGLINIYDKFTFVEVPEDMAEKVLGVMHKNTIKGYKINVEPARVRQ